jgi:hypothetical protein
MKKTVKSIYTTPTLINYGDVAKLTLWHDHDRHKHHHHRHHKKSYS